jgi:ElaB/YqjD/DUF883 family membrane-anchored ribosome-binding protein
LLVAWQNRWEQWRNGRLAMATVSAGLAVALLGCGESAEEEALAEVCGAKADIAEQIDELQDTTVATATVDQVRGNLEAIQADLEQIVDATGDLATERRAQVEQATDDFRSSVDETLSNLGQSESLEAGRAQVSTAIDDLARSYEEALEPIECE